VSALPRTTIYYWVKDLPIPRTERQHRSQRKATRVTRLKHRRLREAAYEEGCASYGELAGRPTFRAFVVLYICEGYKRCRNSVSVANSDPAVIRLAAWWIRRLTTNKVFYAVQYHADQNLDELREFWSAELDVPDEAIRLQRKSNSNQLAGRKWRSRYGVLAVGVDDTYLRARLQAWMDLERKEWLDSLAIGV
jgi:hypothetical protein